MTLSSTSNWIFGVVCIGEALSSWDLSDVIKTNNRKINVFRNITPFEEALDEIPG
jgi:hypothetical protein